MFFSVIIPVYNVEKFIARGMECLDRQTFRDFEVIMVDDGSTDGSSALLDELKMSHDNVRVFHQANAGTGPSRNLGIKKARGEFILFYDIDDLLRPDALTKIAEIIKKNYPDVAVFSYTEVCPALKTRNDFLMPDMVLSSNRDVRDIYIEHLSGIRFNNGYVWNKVYRREFIIVNHLRFKPLRMQQDEVFNLDVYPLVNCMVLSSVITYDYYVYQIGNVSSSLNKQRPEIMIAVRDAFFNLAMRWELSHNDLLTYIHSRFICGYIINSLERDIFSEQFSSKCSGSLQYIRRLIYNPAFSESVQYLSSNKYLPRTFFNKLYFKSAYSKSAVKLYIIAYIKLRVNKVKKLLRKGFNIFMLKK